MNSKIRLILTVSAMVFLASCGREERCGIIPESYEKRNDVKIERLESIILSLDTKEKFLEFINREPVIAEEFLLRSQYPNDSIFAYEMVRRFSHPMIDTLDAEIKRIFPDLSQIEKEFQQAFDLLRHYYPEVQVPEIKTVATGFDHDMLVSDSLIIIGLDFYMGDEARFRPLQTYNYILKRYQPKYIVPSVMLLYGISPRFNAGDEADKTILADMISYGKSYYFTKRMLPCTSDSVLIWYTDREMIELRDHEKFVWSHFLEKDLLWETDHFLKRKYLEERPKTDEISPDCPARVGTWLGWQIVDAYMERHPETPFQELMKIRDARKLFEESRYKPD